jgi:hypothetical protein
MIPFLPILLIGSGAALVAWVLAKPKPEQKKTAPVAASVMPPAIVTPATSQTASASRIVGPINEHTPVGALLAGLAMNPDGSLADTPGNAALLYRIVAHLKENLGIQATVPLAVAAWLSEHGLSANGTSVWATPPAPAAAPDQQPLPPAIPPFVPLPTLPPAVAAAAAQIPPPSAGAPSPAMAAAAIQNLASLMTSALPTASVPVQAPQAVIASPVTPPAATVMPPQAVAPVTSGVAPAAQVIGPINVSTPGGVILAKLQLNPDGSIAALSANMRALSELSDWLKNYRPMKINVPPAVGKWLKTERGLSFEGGQAWKA